MNNNNLNCGTSRSYDPNKVMGAELVKSRNLNLDTQKVKSNEEFCDEFCDEACDEVYCGEKQPNDKVCNETCDETCDDAYCEDDCESVSECEN